MVLAQSTVAARITVVLAGVAISNLFNAGIDAVVTLVPDALNSVTDFRIGGFTGVTMSQLAAPARIIAVSLVLLLTLSHQLDILSLGTDTAKSLGLAVGRMRIVFLILAAALAGAAVSFAGLRGFYGLVVPHIMRPLAGEDSGILLAATALGGAFFMVLCDLVARVLFSPFEIPVGIVLSFAEPHFPVAFVPTERRQGMIQTRQLSAGYLGKTIVKDITLDFHPGEVLVLLGPNGAANQPS